MDGTGSWRYWSMPHLGFGSTGRALTLTLTRGYQQQQLAHVVETDEHAHQLQEDLPHLSAPCAPPAFLLLLGGEGTEDLPIDHEAHGCAEDEVCDPEDHHIQGLRTLRGPPPVVGGPRMRATCRRVASWRVGSAPRCSTVPSGCDGRDRDAVAVRLPGGSRARWRSGPERMGSPTDHRSRNWVKAPRSTKAWGAGAGLDVLPCQHWVGGATTSDADGGVGGVPPFIIIILSGSLSRTHSPFLF